MRIGVVGTGALGGFYGACLDRAGHEVHFLARSDYDVLAGRGMTVTSPTGDMHLNPCRVHRDASAMPACDVVLLATKTTANTGLADQLRMPLTDKGFVCVLQNGLGNEEEVAAIVGPERVCGGLCFLCSNRLAPGRIAHLDYGKVAFGDHQVDNRPAGITSRIEQLAAAFTAGGVDTELAEDLRLVRWKKLVWNVPYNGLSVVLDASTDRLIADEGIRDLVLALMREVQAAAAGEGRIIDDAFIDLMVAHTEQMTPYRTSMKIDAEEGRPLEVEHLFGNPVRAAQAAGVAVPRMQTLYRQLSFIDRRPA